MGSWLEPAILLDAGLDADGGVRLAAEINDAGEIGVAWDRRDDAGDNAMESRRLPANSS